MLLQKLILIIFVVSVCAEDYNYQDRYIYKSEFLNVCSGGAKDFLDLHVTFEDRSPIQGIMNGQTSCMDYQLLKILSLQPSIFGIWTDIDLDAEINFEQETIYKKLQGVVYAIVQRLSVKNSSFNKQSYDCVVQGDGTIRDYGPYESVPAPKVYIHCKKSEIQSII